MLPFFIFTSNVIWQGGLSCDPSDDAFMRGLEKLFSDYTDIQYSLCQYYYFALSNILASLTLD